MSRRYRRVKAIGFSLILITFLASAVAGLYIALSGDSIIARRGDETAGSFVATASFFGIISAFVVAIVAVHLFRQRGQK